MEKKICKKLKLYHGTNDTSLNSIIANGFHHDSWFAKHDFHAYRLAVRRSKQRGGTPVVIEVEVNETDIDRVYGRDLPTYKLKTNGIRAKKVMKLSTFTTFQEESAS